MRFLFVVLTCLERGCLVGHYRRIFLASILAARSLSTLRNTHTLLSAQVLDALHDLQLVSERNSHLLHVLIAQLQHGLHVFDTVLYKLFEVFLEIDGLQEAAHLLHIIVFICCSCLRLLDFFSLLTSDSLTNIVLR